MVIKNGEIAVLKYEGKLETGELFDSTEKEGKTQLFEFEVGAKQVIPGFENAIKTMEKGQKKKFELAPAEAYGEKNPALEQEIQKNLLPPGQEPKEGMILVMSSPDGRQFPVRIKKVSEETIIIDLNHPLAGKKLVFDVEVVDVKNKK